MLHTRHAVTIDTAVGAVLVLVALDGQTLTNDSEKNTTVFLASMDLGFFTDGQEPTPKGDSEITKGATPFLVVKVKPSIMIWNMPVPFKRRGGPGSSQRNCRVVEQTWTPVLDFQIRQ